METLAIVLIAVAAPFVVGIPLTLLGAQLIRQQPLRSDVIWLIAPLVGMGAIVLIAQNLLYLNLRIPYAAALIWFLSIGAWGAVLKSQHLRSAFRPIPVRVLAGGIAIYMLHASGLLASGAGNYYGYGWVDMYNYVAQAQYFLDYPFHSDTHDYQFLRTAQLFKEDRIGQSVLHAFIAASSGTDAQYSFGPTILLSPYLLFFVVYLYCIKLNLAAFSRWAVSFAASALPAVATVHLECFLSQALAIPLLAFWPMAIAWLLDRPSAARVIPTAMLLALILTIYTEIGVVALAIAIFYIVHINVAARRSFVDVSSHLRSAGSQALVLGALIAVALLFNPYFIASTLSIFGRVGSANVLGGIYPWAYEAEGFARVWFGDRVTLWSAGQMQTAGVLGASLIAIGLAGLLFNFWKTKNSLAMIAAAIGAIPLIPAVLGGSNYSYQFYKLLLSVSPFYVLGIGALLSDLSSQSTVVGHVAKTVLIGAATTIAICTGGMTYGASLANTTALSGRGGAYMLLSPETKEVKRYLGLLHNATVVILWYDNKSSKGHWINAWLEYFSRHNRVWSMNYGRPSTGDFVLNRTAYPELSRKGNFVVSWVEVPSLAAKLVYSRGPYWIYKTDDSDEIERLVQASRPILKRSLRLSANANEVQPEIWYPIWVSGTIGNASLLTRSLAGENAGTLRYDHWGYPPLFFFEKGQCRGDTVSLVISLDLADDSLELNCNNTSEKKYLPTPSLFSLDANPIFGSSQTIRALGSERLSTAFPGNLDELQKN